MNERVTEDIFRKHIHNDNMYKGQKIILEEQQSKNTKIQKLLRHASKSGTGRGYFDFMIRFKNNNDFLIIVECKSDIKSHESKERNNYKSYAVDGVLLYSSFLAKEYDVLSIAISGNNKTNMSISHFLQLKNTESHYKIFEENKLFRLNEYIEGYEKDERKFNQDFKELLKYSKCLNNKLHSLNVKESYRSLLISGILIALTDKAFIKSYKDESPRSLSNSLVRKIGEKLSEVQTQNIEDINTAYGFIKTHTILSKEYNKLKEIIEEIDDKVNNFIKTYNYFDTLGQFYIEFLRYANNDTKLGIVLTPPHITELFCEIANINKDSIILDTCTGTGGFLISAMKKMILDAGEDFKKKKDIKNKQIVGIELEDNIYSLLCSNMYIHDDGRSNLIKGSCFDECIKKRVAEFKPNVGFLNPPYKIKESDNEELNFVLNNLEQLAKGSYCVAIVPMSCMMFNKGEGLKLKKKILEEHTLEAVFSMNDELFHSSDVSVVTAIMVLKANEPHPSGYKTYFSYWKDDGFIKVKHSGRIDYYNRWQSIKNKYLNKYRNKDELEGLSIKKSVTADDEWCSEAYINTNYKKLNEDSFVLNIKNYLAYLFLRFDNLSITNKIHTDNKMKLNIKNWVVFNYTDVFLISKGKRLTKKDQISGRYPYVSSSGLNNGIDNYVEKPTNENCITFASYGSIGEVFYQKDKIWVSDNANVFRLKNNELNVYTAMFLITLLKLEKFRFSYGMPATKERLETFKIKLPSKEGNTPIPDWKFMEDYIKSLPFSKSFSSSLQNQFKG